MQRSMRLGLRFTSVIVVGGLLAGVTGACGSGESDEQKIREAREEGEKAARQEERLKQLEREVRRRERRRSAGGSPSPPRSAPPAESTAGKRDCGGGVTAGPNTTCSFAQEVKKQYLRSGGGNATISAYSPATNRSYTMSCTGGNHAAECTGGNNASVELSF